MCLDGFFLTERTSSRGPNGTCCKEIVFYLWSHNGLTYIAVRSGELQAQNVDLVTVSAVAALAGSWNVLGLTTPESLICFFQGFTSSWIFYKRRERGTLVTALRTTDTFFSCFVSHKDPEQQFGGLAKSWEWEWESAMSISISFFTSKNALQRSSYFIHLYIAVKKRIC